MKDNLSIIFALIISVFLVVLLPLYSILDRQDSMSYNVVLTQTTNFVDGIRNNGFLDLKSYNEYIQSLSSTGNTYKVTLEAYRKILIPETDAAGNVIKDTYTEEIELYNTQDILEILEGKLEEDNVKLQETNKKAGVYLFNKNDEIYVKVYNTNTTAGSIIYKFIAGVDNSDVINISYGGIINSVNWELYEQSQESAAFVPEVVVTVPVNALGNTNIMKLSKDKSEEGYIDCTLVNLEEYIGEVSIEKLCGDTFSGNMSYTYLYDLEKVQNKSIKFLIELRRFNKINTGVNKFTDISELKESDFKDINGKKSAVESYIIENFVQLNGMYAGVDLTLLKTDPYYVFEVTLTNVRMSSLDYISSFASVSILPGLGIDEYGTFSTGTETVQIEITDSSSVQAVAISAPHCLKKLEKTKSLTESMLESNRVYKSQELAFVISYMGLSGYTNEEIIAAILKNLKVYSQETKLIGEFTEDLGLNSSSIELIGILTGEEFNKEYEINIETGRAKHIVLIFYYKRDVKTDVVYDNYLEISPDWIIINKEEADQGEEPVYAPGVQSPKYELRVDNTAPPEAQLAITGQIGSNGWYVSDVTIDVVGPKTDNESGIYLRQIALEGANKLNFSENQTVTLTNNGETRVTTLITDNVRNQTRTTTTIKIDKQPPTAPTITLSGTKNKKGWYTSDVKVTIVAGSDSLSGTDTTVSRVEGANARSEGLSYVYTLTENGKSTIIATTYDKAGNKTETKLDVYIDKSTPEGAEFEVISGDKNSAALAWYASDVTLRIKVNAANSFSGLGKASYRITGPAEVPTTEFTGTYKDITITKSGIHNITVYTYTEAGNYAQSEYTLYIDKDKPNDVKYRIVKGTKGQNDWYVSDVRIEYSQPQDNGPSGLYLKSYTIETEGKQTVSDVLNNSGVISIAEEGRHALSLIALDVALNKSEVNLDINIDRTKPVSAEFVIEGEQGESGWYTSDVEISYEGGSDDVSGIYSITLSEDSITENTAGKTVTLTTTNMAGMNVKKETTIKVDKSAPTKPVINIDKTPTGSGAFGMLLYNVDVNINITPGVDALIGGVNNLGKTTYEIIKNSGNTVLVPETEGTSFKVTQEGIITIIARTYDKAGNVSVSTKMLWINKQKPTTPKITRINNEKMGSSTSKEVTGTTNMLTLHVDGLEEGNSVKVTLIEQSTYKSKTVNITAQDGIPIYIELEKKGTYSIKVSQMNMFGTQSETSTELYLYKYI